MTDDSRSLEFEIEVSGTPEEVWRAIATGPGISSWYVPHEVEEREGGAAVARFGPGPEMEVPGRVAAWEPPERIVFDSGGVDEGLAFEWLVEARDGGSCIVRLVNSGFGSGEDWDAQYDGMADGWPLFLCNLQLHLEHFPGQNAVAALPMASWSGSAEQRWSELLAALGQAATPATGERVQLTATEGLSLAGEVVDAQDNRIALLVDEPAPGTAFVAIETTGGELTMSVWSYLYGADGSRAVERDEPRWQEWLNQLTA